MMRLFNKSNFWLNWGFVFPIIVLNLALLIFCFYYLQPAVTIIITAALLAFLLNYPVRILTSIIPRRGYAVGIVFILAITIFITLAITLFPLIIRELEELAKRLPTWIDSGTTQLQLFQAWAIALNLPIDVSTVTNRLEEHLANELQLLPTQIINFALEVFDSTIEIVIVLVLTFYLLLYGDRFWDDLFQGFSPKISQTIKLALHQSFRNYFLGQFAIAFLMGLTLTITFLLLKVPFGLLFGISIGVLVLIPFGDILGIIGVSVLISLKSVWLGGEILIITAIIDQAIDNVLAPRIFGSLVGLNPVWIIISLLLGAKIGGILGLVIAVPIAGTINLSFSNFKKQTTDFQNELKHLQN